MNLLPCPFCGTTPKTEHIGNEHTAARKVIISCPSCRIKRTDAARIHSFVWLEDVAEKSWNQRIKQ